MIPDFLLVPRKNPPKHRKRIRGMLIEVPIPYDWGGYGTGKKVTFEKILQGVNEGNNSRE